MRIVSTLDIHSYGRDTPELRVALDNLHRFVRAGGRVAYGTDLGNGPIPPGIDVREASLLAEAGLGLDGVLQAMTDRPLDAGRRADLIASAEDPRDGLDAFGRLVLVVRAGRVVQ